MGRHLEAGDIAEAAERLDVGEAHVRALVAVESEGSGFIGRYENGPRLPKILFEAHQFSKRTGGDFDASHPKLSSPVWDRTLYLGGLAEHDRLHEAAALDFQAAYEATSWGMFQIMGFNHPVAGFARLEDFVGVQFVSEGMQLQCGVAFIVAEGLDDALRSEDWRTFARGYNGAGYEKNRYHERLAAAYERFRHGPPAADVGVAELQRALNVEGFALHVDGVSGPQTEAAIREFQAEAGLVVDGIAGPETLHALGLA